MKYDPPLALAVGCQFVPSHVTEAPITTQPATSVFPASRLRTPRGPARSGGETPASKPPLTMRLRPTGAVTRTPEPAPGVKRNARPTFPGPNVAPPSRVP